MATLREIARRNLDEVRDGIAWVAIWKTGRSWNAETFYPDDVNDSIPVFGDETDVKRLREIVHEDPAAVILNAEYHNLGGLNELTAQTLALMLRWQYEDVGKWLIADYLPADSEKKQMIYTLEKRHEFGGGTMSTYWGLFKYEKRYANGTLANGTLVKRFDKKADGSKYCIKHNIALEE